MIQKTTTKYITFSALVASAMFLQACSSTALTAGTSSTLQQRSTAVVSQQLTTVNHNQLSNPKANADANKPLYTLEQIMADPDWLGRQPTQAGWKVGEDIIRFSRKRAGSPIQDIYHIDPNNIVSNGQRVDPAQQHLYAGGEVVYSPYAKHVAWLYNDRVLLLRNGETIALTPAGQTASNIRFLQDGRVAYQLGQAVLATHLTTLQTSTLFTWYFKEAPVANQPIPDYIAEEQHKLIQYIANKRNDRATTFAHKQTLDAANPFTGHPQYYFDSNERLAAVSVSANGKWAIIATTAKGSWRDESDIMPHYIQENARIASVPVRRRVADAKPRTDHLFLLELATGEKHSLSLANLPGYNEDVLAAVKSENAARKGETYTPNRLPRPITLFSSWYWSEPPIYWHNQANEVGIMLEAWDNKDRWIVTVDFTTKQLVTQHRLSDEAWINYAFNRFGWLHDEVALYYLSEETGYSHLYKKPLDAPAQALTSGKYEVDQVTQSADGRYFYFKANKKHPGIYEIYRVDSQGESITALTDFNGMTDYELSPSGEQLLLTHSSLTMPPELYLVPSAGFSEQSPVRVTNTVSQAYLAMNFTAPSIIEVPSSHVDRPIYSRLYMDSTSQNDASKPAVIFNHGAGYLQNAHLGWSGYFREFMFHQLLVQQGYVVLDMDYRASKGYGRDWRTAIYRQMGTPETQDLVDGVEWLVQNANVDRARIGTYGGSYGGFMTFMALFTEPELFQAGAALRPVSDWAHYNTPYTSNILNTPDVDPIAYERSSPIYFAEGLSKPLLMNAPMVDDNVFFVDVVRLVQRLIELEKTDFETAIYPVEPHGFVQPSSWLDEYRRIFKLFETHVK